MKPGATIQPIVFQLLSAFNFCYSLVVGTTQLAAWSRGQTSSLLDFNFCRRFFITFTSCWHRPARDMKTGSKVQPIAFQLIPAFGNQILEIGTTQLAKLWGSTIPPVGFLCMSAFWEQNIALFAPPNLRQDDELNNPAYRISIFVGVLKSISRVLGTTQLATRSQDQQSSLQDFSLCRRFKMKLSSFWHHPTCDMNTGSNI